MFFPRLIQKRCPECGITLGLTKDGYLACPMIQCKFSETKGFFEGPFLEWVPK